MANFGGFEMETPQEVLARMQAQRSKVMTTGNIQQQRNQNIETALDTLFGNPELRAASRRQDAIQRAMTSSGEKKDGEDDLDYQLRRLQTMRDAVADVSPETASQINQQLLVLGQQKFERGRLQAQDKRSQEEHDIVMKKAKDEEDMRKAFGQQTYVFDTNSGEAQSFNLNDPNANADFIEAAKKPGTRVITPDQAWQLYLQNNSNAARLREALARADGKDGAGSKVEQQRLENSSAGLLDVYATADRILQVFEENPDAITGSAKGGQAIDKLATELGAAGRLATGAKLRDSDLSIDDWFKANSITSTRMQGLAVGLAYATAKANDPSGRISDKDLAAALQMIGSDNPNPVAILANLNDSLTARNAALTDRISTSTPAAREALADRLELLKNHQKEFKSKIAKYATGGRGPGAVGVDSPQSNEIDDIIAKYPKK